MQKHFNFAVEVIHERIRLDQQKVNQVLAEALQSIDANIFNSKFRAGSLKLPLAARTLFSEVFDATPSLYIRVRRIEVALFLLDYTDGKVPAIAKLVGYPTPATFNYTFKKTMGCSPIEERQRWRSQDHTESLQASRLAFGHRPNHHRIHGAPIDRRSLVGAIEPHSVAFQLCHLRYLNSKDVDEVSWLHEGKARYMEKIQGDPRAIPDVPDLLCKVETLSHCQELEFLERSARPTLNLLEAHEISIPSSLRSMVNHLHANITNPNYRLDRLRDEVGAHHADRSEFSRCMGVTPHQYLFESRMETTSRLLRDSPLSVAVISQLMGYADPPQFRRAFKNWSGELSPDQYRKRVRQVAARVGPAPARFIHWRFLEQIRGAEREKAMEMVLYIERVYGFNDIDPALLLPTMGGSGSGWIAESASTWIAGPLPAEIARE